MEIISLSLLVVVIAIGLVDLVPIVADWLGRVHIGRYADRRVWNRSIVGKGSRWLTKTPKIKVTDHTRIVVLDMLRGQYTKNAIQAWQEASLLLGLSEYVKRQSDPAAKREIERFLRRKWDRQGRWVTPPRQVDEAILAYALLRSETVEPDHYRPAFDATWELIRSQIGPDGTVQYRSFMKGYRYVDTIGFICPFLAAYGIRYRKPECVDLAVRQICAYDQYGMLAEHHIPCHAYRLEDHTPLGLYGWGRGLGWYAIGLIDTWRELPDGHPAKSRLAQSIRSFAKAAIRFQQPAGHWNWSVARSESRPDSSTTAALAWFLANAALLEGVAVECRQSADKAISYLMKVTRRDGAVDFSQGDTKDIGVYSMLFNVLPFTQGLCIRAVNFIEGSGPGR